jgi:hypothetical protein
VRWQLTVRSGPKVKKQSFRALDEALTVLEQQAREVAENPPDEAVDAKIRRFEPAEQVLARLELAGPERFVASVRAGVDVHGDGSVEAYRGRVRRQAIEPRRGETVYAALRRAVEEEAPEGSSHSTLT